VPTRLSSVARTVKHDHIPVSCWTSFRDPDCVFQVSNKIIHPRYRKSLPPPIRSRCDSRHTCVPCKRYEVLADSAARSDATPSLTFCPQLLECSNSVCENRTPLQKPVVFPGHITQERYFEWPLEWLLPRQQCPDRMRCTP
jgi:hypothetical protein